MKAIAETLVEELRPYVERIAIAGSIRRERPEVADIELVCVPKFGDAHLAGELIPTRQDLLKIYCLRRLQFDGGRWQHRPDKNGRPAFGDHFKRLVIDRTPIDLFSVTGVAQWGAIFLIRTGPAEFSRKMVTQRNYGGYLPSECLVQHGAVWRDGAVIPMPEEADYFALCGRVELSPRART